MTTGWHFVAYTNNAGAEVLYVDGSSIGTGSTAAIGTGSVTIGNWNGFLWNGKIDNVCVRTSAALTSGQVSALYAAGDVGC